MPEKRTSYKSIPFEMKKMGDYLKKLREELGMSIRQAATAAKFTPGYLSKIEAGDTFKSIGVGKLVQLSKTYGIPIGTILQEAGFLENNDDRLPEFAQYLRSKYLLSPQAIRDMEMAKEIVDRKYQIEREKIK
ncbi:MAG: helix-turn-helix transcriptional regulator [bacterium]|nr:helix-turn-helix transcriptional regulator [bacterium]